MVYGAVCRDNVVAIWSDVGTKSPGCSRALVRLGAGFSLDFESTGNCFMPNKQQGCLKKAKWGQNLLNPILSPRSRLDHGLKNTAHASFSVSGVRSIRCSFGLLR